MTDAARLELGPPPPKRPPCAGADPALFDVTDPDAAGPALAYCERCPVSVVAWCSAVVRPRTSRFDGVAAGRVWSGGKDKGGLEDEATG